MPAATTTRGDARSRGAPAWSAGQPPAVAAAAPPRPQRPPDHVAEPHRLGGLRRAVVDVHLATVASGGGQGARLERPRRPEPPVEAHGIPRIHHAPTVS